MTLKKATRSEKALELLNCLMFDVYFLQSKFIKEEKLLSVISYTVFHNTEKKCIVNNRFCKITYVSTYMRSGRFNRHLLALK